MPKPPPLKPYSFALPPELVSQVDKLATADNRSRSYMVVHLLTEALAARTPSPEKAPE